MFSTMKRKIGALGIALFLLGLMVAPMLVSGNVQAGPEIIGNPYGASSRAIITDGETVKRIVYVDGPITMANTTPVNSDVNCGNFGSLHAVQVQLEGTMTGTGPTLAMQWQNSLDGGVTWSNVGALTTINATVTPALQKQVVSDISNATTAVAYGDCWRVQYTFGGSGTVSANVNITGIEK